MKRLTADRCRELAKDYRQGSATTDTEMAQLLENYADAIERCGPYDTCGSRDRYENERADHITHEREMMLAILTRSLDHDPVVVPPSHKIVPVEPTDEMIEAGRTAVMARDCSSNKWTPRDHYEHTSDAELHLAVTPKNLLDCKGPLPKAAGALLVWYAMVGAAPND